MRSFCKALERPKANAYALDKLKAAAQNQLSFLTRIFDQTELNQAGDTALARGFQDVLDGQLDFENWFQQLIAHASNMLFDANNEIEEDFTRALGPQGKADLDSAIQQFGEKNVKKTLLTGYCTALCQSTIRENLPESLFLMQGDSVSDNPEDAMPPAMKMLDQVQKKLDSLKQSDDSVETIRDRAFFETLGNAHEKEALLAQWHWMQYCATQVDSAPQLLCHASKQFAILLNQQLQRRFGQKFDADDIGAAYAAVANVGGKIRIPSTHIQIATDLSEQFMSLASNPELMDHVLEGTQFSKESEKDALRQVCGQLSNTLLKCIELGLILPENKTISDYLTPARSDTSERAKRLIQKKQEQAGKRLGDIRAFLTADNLFYLEWKQGSKGSLLQWRCREFPAIDRKAKLFIAMKADGKTPLTAQITQALEIRAAARTWLDQHPGHSKREAVSRLDRAMTREYLALLQTHIEKETLEYYRKKGADSLTPESGQHSLRQLNLVLKCFLEEEAHANPEQMKFARALESTLRNEYLSLLKTDIEQQRSTDESSLTKMTPQMSTGTLQLTNEMNKGYLNLFQVHIEKEALQYYMEKAKPGANFTDNQKNLAQLESTVKRYLKESSSSKEKRQFAETLQATLQSERLSLLQGDIERQRSEYLSRRSEATFETNMEQIETLQEALKHFKKFMKSATPKQKEFAKEMQAMLKQEKKDLKKSNGNTATFIGAGVGLTATMVYIWAHPTLLPHAKALKAAMDAGGATLGAAGGAGFRAASNKLGEMKKRMGTGVRTGMEAGLFGKETSPKTTAQENIDTEAKPRFPTKSGG